MIDLVVRPAAMSDYELALSTRGVTVGRPSEVMLADPSLLPGVDLSEVRWVQSTWAGVDAIDWAAVPPQVTVTSLPGVFGPQIAEFVLGHLLARTQRVVARYGTLWWDSTPPAMLRGTRLGVLGAGSIGRAVAGAASALGVVVVGCRRSGAPDPAFDRMYPVAELDSFLDGLDHLVAVLPATPESAGLVDAAALARLRPGASFVNVGRGATVDTGAVLEAAASGQLGVAVLDVTDPEPLPDDHPAWSTPNVVVTGHTAALSLPDDVVGFFVENLTRFREGAGLAGVVDRSKGY